MRYGLNGLPVQTPAATALHAQGIGRGARDLLTVLESRRATFEDARLEAGGLRAASVTPRAPCVRWPGSGGERPVAKDFLPEVRRWVGLGQKDFVQALHESPETLARRLDRALEERGDSWGGFLVRLESGRVRAILPRAYRPLDHLDAARVFHENCRRWRDRGVDVRIDACEESAGDLFLAACAPSLAAEVREGDWLYAGISLSNSECTSAPLEVKPRIYRSICANGAIIQEAEAEGFEIVKVSTAAEPEEREAPVISLGRRMARAFELAFRPERVEREAAIGRAAAQSTLASPFEHLQHLVAGGLLDAAERDRAQRLFEEGNDASLYGLANAVTAAAHDLRDADPRRAGALEHLGAEILRGEHGPPVGAPVRV